MELMVSGFSQILSPLNLLIMLVGVVVGVVFGAIPGLTGLMAIGLCLPFTFGMDMIPSFCLLMSLYIGGMSGGLISAVLINIPGSPASVATTFDGAPLARSGQGGKALGVGVFYSFLGNVFGILVLMFLAPPLGALALEFGVFEYFAVAIFSLTLVSALSGDSIVKGLIACLIGLFVVCIGAAPIDGFSRFTFGFHALDGGFEQIPVLVGMFAVSEILKFAREDQHKMDVVSQDVRLKGLGFTWKEFKGQIPNALRSAILGTFIGILPGIGGATCNILAYGVAKKSSKYPEKFGTGIIDGIVAPEISNNASIGGAMVPMLTLGIPGDATTALLLGAITIQGLHPGPLFFQDNIGFIYAIFAAMLVCSLLTVFVQFFGMRGFIRMLEIPRNILLPMVMVLCFVGAFGISNRIFDAWSLLFFGLLGFALSHFKVPLTPIIMGFVLGPIVELYLRRGLILAKGDFMRFMTRPISGTFITLAILMVVYSLLKPLIQKRKNAAKAKTAQ